MEMFPPSFLLELKQGDTKAFNRLYSDLRPGLYAFILRMTGQRDVAEDLLQEAWMRFARNVASLKDDTNLHAWLFTVASNLCRSHRRWRVVDLKRMRDVLVTPKQQTPSPFELVAATDAQARLERALVTLSPSDREVLLLVGIEGLTPTEASAVLGLRPEALRQRLARARARLAAVLGESDTSLSLQSIGGRR